MLNMSEILDDVYIHINFFVLFVGLRLLFCDGKSIKIFLYLYTLFVQKTTQLILAGGKNLADPSLNCVFNALLIGVQYTLSSS